MMESIVPNWWDYKTRMPADLESMKVTPHVGNRIVGSVETLEFAVTERDMLPQLGSYFRTGRFTPPGEYTKLVVDGRLMMSDVWDEMMDHMSALRVSKYRKARRIVINGLGLGCLVKGLLTLDSVEHIDVVELSEDLIELTADLPWVKDDRVHVHHGDALMYDFPRGTKWDIAWHDIWPTINPDFDDEYKRLNRRYGNRVRWQGAWAQGLMRAVR